LTASRFAESGFVITINAVAVANARESDSRGRPLPSWQGCRIVGEHEVFLLNPQSVDSLDGRYFGVLPVSSIVDRALPLWIRKPLGEMILSFLGKTTGTHLLRSRVILSIDHLLLVR
jgi:hypothetical protein